MKKLYCLAVLLLACDTIPDEDPAPSITGLSEPQRIEQMSRDQIINELSREAARRDSYYGAAWDTTITIDGCTLLLPKPPGKGWVLDISGTVADKTLSATWVKSEEPTGTQAAQHEPWCSANWGGPCYCGFVLPPDTTGSSRGNGSGSVHYHEQQEYWWDDGMGIFGW